MNKNPFLETLTVPYLRIIKRDVTNLQMLDPGLQPGDYYDVEIEKSTRVYRSIKRFMAIKDMSAGGLRALMWMMYTIPEKATSIKINDVELSTVLDCSCRQVARIRAELIQFALIAKRKENEYWINPRYFASGDRLKLYPGNTLQEAQIKQS